MVRRVEKVEPNFRAVEISMRSSRVHVTVELGCTPIRNTSPPGGDTHKLSLTGAMLPMLACMLQACILTAIRGASRFRRSFPGAARPRRTSTAASSGRPACCVLQLTCLHVHLYPRVRSELIRCVTRPPPPPVLRPARLTVTHALRRPRRQSQPISYRVDAWDFHVPFPSLWLLWLFLSLHRADAKPPMHRDLLSLVLPLLTAPAALPLPFARLCT